MADLPPRMQVLLRRSAALEQQAIATTDPSNAVRQRLLGADAAKRSRRRRVPLALAAGAMAAVAFALAWLHAKHPTLDAQFDDGTLVQAAPGTLFTATRPGGAVLRFSDGSSVRMQPHASVSITAIDASGATIAVDGRAYVFVQHRASSKWALAAGPFVVHVTGTRFDIAWDDATKVLKLRMAEGAVQVSGCSLTGLQLRAPQSMEARCGDSQAEITTREAAPPAVTMSARAEPSLSSPPAAHPTAPTSAPGPLLTVRPSEGDAGTPPTSEAGPPPPGAGRTPDWRDLVADGRFREAYAAAENEGFDAQCDRANAADLLALADAARFAGRTDRARTTLSCVRRRFAGSPSAAMAAFRLGTIAEDEAHEHSEASMWFRTYLQEQPDGTFAREASGRVIEVDQAEGNLEAARALARAYLLRWPSGPHAPLARSLVGD